MAWYPRRLRRSSATCARVQPALEELERRLTPTTIEWINPAGGAWDDPSNWDLGRTPLPDDDVLIPNLNYSAVIDHASGDDTVHPVLAQADFLTLAITNQSSLTVADSIHVPTLAAATGGVLTAYNTGSLDINLGAQGGGEIYLPLVMTYHATVFTNITAMGEDSLIDLPALTSMMASMAPPIPGETRLDVIADQGGTINLPALASVRGHPPDYFVGNTALLAENGGTCALDPSGTVTFAAGGSLGVDRGSDLQAGELVVDDSGELSVSGSVEASSLVVGGAGASVTVSGSLTLSGTYTQDLGSTTFEAGAVTVGDLFDIRGGDVFGSGTINGDVSNAGSLTAFRAFTINGNYTQTASGQLSVQLRIASDFDQLLITGFAMLDGTLTATLGMGYQPQPGDALQVVQFGAGAGTFAHVRVSAPLYGVLYVFEPRDGVQPGVTLLF
jgi:hypothetical protein